MVRLSGVGVADLRGELQGIGVLVVADGERGRSVYLQWPARPWPEAEPRACLVLDTDAGYCCADRF